jgi:hypothetical protein
VRKDKYWKGRGGLSSLKGKSGDKGDFSWGGPASWRDEGGVERAGKDSKVEEKAAGA